jgi:hypothetical protein
MFLCMPTTGTSVSDMLTQCMSMLVVIHAAQCPCHARLLHAYPRHAQSFLTLIQPGSGKFVNYWGPFSFDLAFTRCKLTSPGIWQMCYRALRFRESAQNGAAIYLERARNRPDWEPTSHCTLRGPGPEINWKVAWHRTALWTTAQWDFSCARVVCNETGRKREGRQLRDRTSDEKTSKWMSKCHFLMSCQKFKKICKTCLQE